ncbi:MAG: TIGR04255 family protein [Planctomycetota bacterium]
MPKDEVYKNSPLAETVFEIRFPGEPVIECRRDKFYERIRDTYPNVFVPNAVEGKAMALEPYGFETKDGSCGIRLAINKIAFYCKKYEGFDAFKKESLRIFSLFEDVFKIKTISRTGLRYINFIPYTKENDLIPLKNYLTVELLLPKSLPSDFKNLGIIFTSKMGEGIITTRIEPERSADMLQEVIILDFDYARTGDLEFSQISKYLDDSHKHTKIMFESLIADGYRKFMQGETI